MIRKLLRKCAIIFLSGVPPERQVVEGIPFSLFQVISVREVHGPQFTDDGNFSVNRLPSTLFLSPEAGQFIHQLLCFLAGTNTLYQCDNDKDLPENTRKNGSGIHYGV